MEVPRAVAEQALVDPEFYRSMEAMGPIGTPEVLARSDEPDGIRIAVRYRFTGDLSRPARAVLDPDKLTWVIESLMHMDAHFADFTMLPDHYADRLECAGLYRFEDKGDRSVQVIDAELRVHVPLVAGAVERAILMGLRQHMAEHAQLVVRWARSESSSG